MVSIPIHHVLLLSILAVIASGDARSRFLERLNEAIRDDAAVLMAAENEYADYVDRYGKLNAYLAADVGDVKAHYMAYQENKAEIERLNAKATHHDEHYSVNALTDLTAAEKQAMLIPLSSLPSHRRLGWADVDDCITVSSGSLPTDAGSRSDTAMALGSCGSVKSQGRLGSCWAFASTAQIQCNYNEEKNADEVFSEKYATDCTDGSIGTVNRGGLMHKLTEWYDTNGACTSFHKEYDGSDRTEYDGDCGCQDTKTYGQCYALYADNDGDVIAAAATEHAWDFGIALCNSFFSADDTWYGCGADESPRGGHAMTIVGQQSGDKILVRNSWGSSWGMDGQFAGHVWIHKSAWSTAAGTPFRSIPMTRTQFDGDRDDDDGEEEEGDCECSEEEGAPSPLEWKGWTPPSSSLPLSECQGDCDSDTECEGDLRCFQDAVPPGCYGSLYASYADYCYDPTTSSAVFAAPNELTPPEEYVDAPWSLTITGKDMAILVLVAVNAVTMMAVYCLCSRAGSKGYGARKYQVVSVGDSELE